MSLLMQALKKAEQAKLKLPQSEEHVPTAPPPEKAALSQSASPAVSLHTTQEPGEIPNLEQILPLDEIASSQKKVSEIELTHQEPLSLIAENFPVPEAATREVIVPETRSVASDPAVSGSIDVRQEPITSAPDAPLFATSAVDARPPSIDPPIQPAILLETVRVDERTRRERESAKQEEATQVNVTQQKAKAVFAAKRPPRRSRIGLIAGITIIMLLLACGVGFYYWQIRLQDNSQFTPSAAGQQVDTVRPAAAPAQTVDPQNQGTVRPAQVEAINSAPAGSGAAASTPTEQVATGGATSAQDKRAPDGAPLRGHDASAGADSAREPSLPDAAVRASREAISAERKSERSVQPAASDQIEIHKGAETEKAGDALSSAYALFSSGDMAGARPLYETVLRDDPNNRDALLGLAAIAIRENQSTKAGSLYSKLLDLNPSDPDAISGLISLRHGDQEQSESLLKKVLAQHPQSGAAFFELGNVYSQQGRWGEAQQAYFNAYATAPGSADYAFNLAVSLDQLGQKKLALQYYLQSVEAARNFPGKFQPEVARERIGQLQGARPAQ